MKEGCVQIIERSVVLGGDKCAVLMMASVPPDACYKGSEGFCCVASPLLPSPTSGAQQLTPKAQKRDLRACESPKTGNSLHEKRAEL